MLVDLFNAGIALVGLPGSFSPTEAVQFLVHVLFEQVEI